MGPVLCLGLLGIVGGCEDVLSRDSTLNLRQQIIESTRRQINNAGDAEVRVVETTGDRSYLEENPERIEMLDETSGPRRNLASDIDLGPGLDGQTGDEMYLSLAEVVRIAVRNNIDLKLARLAPASSEAQLAAAEAVFDAVFFAQGAFVKTDQPQAQFANVVGGTVFPIGQPAQIVDSANLTTGIRKPLDTGGQIQISAALDQQNNKTPGQLFVPDPSYTSTLSLQITQPLLRSFGSYVNRSQILLTENAHRLDLLAFHNQLLSTAGDAEELYWRLVQARHNLAIQQRFYERTVETRDGVQQRQAFDASPIQHGQSETRVGEQRESVIRARQAVRDISDQLKAVMNDPRLPLSGEHVLIPTDQPVEAPVEYNLLDSVTTALRKRPDIRAALLSIDSTSIQMAVADNQRLPILNINAQMDYRGLDGNPGNSVDRLVDADFITYLIGAQFEQPIGNRAAEANYRASRIQRQQAVLQYQQGAQLVVQALKRAMRDMRSSFQLIDVARASRRAAAEALRAIDERGQIIEALTPEYLEVKLNAQQRLALAETREIQAMVDYNIGVARVHQFTGTLLERNQIELAWPEGMFND